MAEPEPASQDVGNAVHLEHINLEVPDLDLARVFYAEGLGLTADPDTLGWKRGGPFVIWFNLGRQQLHIVKAAVPQNTRGTIVLKLPNSSSGGGSSSYSLQQASERLARLQPVLEGTKFSFTVQQQQQQQQQGQQQQGSGGVNASGSSSSRISSIAVTCPWGQRFLLVDEAPDFPWPAGIVELQLPCFPGTAHHIARFYSGLLDARVADDSGGGSSSSGGVAATPAECRVFLGPGCCLRFQEDEALGELTPQAVEELWTGWHVAFYIASFRPAFQRTLELGINQLDHPYRDKAPDMAGALSSRQFRFKDVVDLDASGKRGQLLYRLGHEVRSLHHPSYMRPLYNRRDGL